MKPTATTRCTAFAGFKLIAAGEAVEVARKTKRVLDRGERAPVLIFADDTGEPVEVDFRGSMADVVRSLGTHTAPAPEVEAAPRGQGRPKLGVVAREVTLLPRHWEWLNSQPGGASVALRKLVDEARKANVGRDQVRRSQEVAYRFTSALAGNLPGFEEAARALFAGDGAGFDAQVKSWPTDVRKYARQLAAVALGERAELSHSRKQG